MEARIHAGLEEGIQAGMEAVVDAGMRSAERGLGGRLKWLMRLEEWELG